MVSRQEITVPEFYKNYVEQAGDDDLLKALNQNTKKLKKLLRDIPRKKVDYAYAEGKWTIKQLLQHIIDAERVFVLRALWFARQDASPQPGFDENIWASHVTVDERKWKVMLDEFFTLRSSTQLFFESLNDDQLQQKGTANNNEMSVATLGFVCAGHVAHHINIINERYLAKKKKKQDKKGK